jgi:hypothetical protein
MNFISIDNAAKEFVVSIHGTEHRFAGTVAGAIELNHFMNERGEGSSMSSDLNHPNEFPDFEEHSIDIVAGYYEGAVKAGLINLVPKESKAVSELLKLKAEYEEANQVAYESSEYYTKLTHKIAAIEDAIERLRALED